MLSVKESQVDGTPLVSAAGAGMFNAILPHIRDYKELIEVVSYLAPVINFTSAHFAHGIAALYSSHPTDDRTIFKVMQGNKSSGFGAATVTVQITDGDGVIHGLWYLTKASTPGYYETEIERALDRDTGSISDVWDRICGVE
jgi:hypothetical protein